MCIMVTELRYTTYQETFVGKFQPYAHQLKTLKAVRDAINKRQTICIENTSVTGSGKTLANFAAAILDGVRTCGVYPTNELLIDQYISLYKKFLPREIAILDSQGLDDITAVHEHMRSHAHGLAWANGDAMFDAVLTNPDVLYLAMYNLYGQMFSTFAMPSGERVFQNMLNNYPVIAFDEFHLYSMKQIANAAFIMGTAKTIAPDKPHVFIFSSATPQEKFKQYVQHLGIEIIPVTDKASPTGNKVVCESVEVNILPANLMYWRGVEQIQAQLHDILQWADSFEPRAHGVFIVDGVYDAKCLADVLRQAYPAHEVGEVHGYMDPDERAGALKCRFSVGTTTIDVGVDLVDEKSKEFLVCEARSAAQAIQRIGRLGRRGREGTDIPIPNRIWLFVPDYVYEYMQRIGDGKTVGRSDLNKALNEAYLGYEEFAAYTEKYSPLEAVAACERVKNQQYFDDNKIQIEESLQRLLITLYGKAPTTDQEQIAQRYEKYKKTQLAIWKKFGTEIITSNSSRKRYYLSDLESFRGGMESDFTVVIYDELDEQLGLKPLKTYNLPFVLRRTWCDELSKRSFEDLVKRNHPVQAEEWLTKLERHHKLLGYMHVRNLLRGKANEAYFEVSESAVSNQYHRVLRLEGLTIDGGLGNWLAGKESINSRLQRRKLNCWISEQNSLRLSKTLHLPPLFAIYPLRLTLPNGKYNDCSIAFGLDAFLLDSIAKKIGWMRPRSDNRAIFL
jgi:CRISPR-associated helicase Cas3